MLYSKTASEIIIDRGAEEKISLVAFVCLSVTNYFLSCRNHLFCNFFTPTNGCYQTYYLPCFAVDNDPFDRSLNTQSPDFAMTNSPMFLVQGSK